MPHGQQNTSGNSSEAASKLMGKNVSQLARDDPKRKNFNSVSYTRAMLSKMQANDGFTKAKEELAEDILTVLEKSVCPVPVSKLMKVEVNEEGRKANSSKPVASYTVKTLQDSLSKRVDQSLGFYRISALAANGKTWTSEWDGQFLVRINSADQTLDVRMLKFVPKLATAEIESLNKNTITKPVQKKAQKNLSRFEMSRQFALQIPLHDVTNLYIYRKNGECSSGVVVLETESSENLLFLQKHTLTNLPLMNKWRQRCSFFGQPATSRTDVPFQLVLGGTYTDMEELTAKALNAYPRVFQAYMRGQTRPKPSIDQHSASSDDDEEERPRPRSEYLRRHEQRIKPKAPKKVHQATQKIRRDILHVLVEADILEKTEAEEIFNNPTRREDDYCKHPSKVNNYLGKLSTIGGEGLHECFVDYVNFDCTDVKDLQKRLAQPLNCSQYGYDLDFFDVDEEDYEDFDIDKMTVAELLKLHKENPPSGDSVFFSFCWGHVAENMSSYHCDRCHQCVNWHYRHCSLCDRCTYGQSIPECDHCGREDMLYDHEPEAKPALGRGIGEGTESELAGGDPLNILSALFGGCVWSAGFYIKDDDCPSSDEEGSSGNDVDGYYDYSDDEDLSGTDLRKAILEVLVEADLIDDRDAKDLFWTPVDLESPTDPNIKPKLNNRLGSIKLQKCFTYYINFKCTSAKSLRKLLEKPIITSDYPADQGAGDARTVRDLLDPQREHSPEDPIFFSFCWRKLCQNKDVQHCDRCHYCIGRQYRHCNHCNRCTYGVPECERCGHICNDPSLVVPTESDVSGLGGTAPSMQISDTATLPDSSDNRSNPQAEPMESDEKPESTSSKIDDTKNKKQPATEEVLSSDESDDDYESDVESDRGSDDSEDPAAYRSREEWERIYRHKGWTITDVDDDIF